MSEELMYAFNTLTLEKKKEVEHFIYFLMSESESVKQQNRMQDFMQLTWEDGRSADEIVFDIESARTSSVRFGGDSGIFA